MMPKEQYTTNLPKQSHTNISEEVLTSSLPTRIGPYRSLSAKRPRDPSHRKSVSFNDVPIVHEVPSHDTMRNSNCDTYRSWTYTDATLPTSVVPSFCSSQVFLPFNSTSAAAQRVHASRLSSTLYSTSSTANTTNRIPDWAIRPKTSKTISTSEEMNTATESNPIGNGSAIIVNLSDEKLNKETTVRTNSQLMYNNPYVAHSQPPVSSPSSLLINPENEEEKKHPYRSAIVCDTEHHRNVPLTRGPLSDSTTIYTSMLSTNLIQSNHVSNEHSVSGQTRTARACSASLPGTAAQSSTRSNDNVSITPLRPTTSTLVPNGSAASARAVLRPTTIAFQCSQAAITTTNATNGTSTVTTATANNSTNNTSQSTTAINTTKPPTIPLRFTSSAAAAAHSRFVLPPNRTLPSASLISSTIKYTFAHPAADSTLTNTITSQATASKPPSTTYPRSRSAHVLNTRRAAASPVIMIDGHPNGGTNTNHTTNLYAPAKRNSNVRQTYGSYYMHRVLLPTTIN